MKWTQILFSFTYSWRDNEIVINETPRANNSNLFHTFLPLGPLKVEGISTEAFRLIILSAGSETRTLLDLLFHKNPLS